MHVHVHVHVNVHVLMHAHVQCLKSIFFFKINQVNMIFLFVSFFSQLNVSPQIHDAGTTLGLKRSPAPSSNLKV